MKVRRLRWRFYRKKGGPPGLGRRCKSYCPDCYVCESYRFFDSTGRFPSFEEVNGCICWPGLGRMYEGKRFSA